jgi:hypothetical protein
LIGCKREAKCVPVAVSDLFLKLDELGSLGRVQLGSTTGPVVPLFDMT